MARQEQAAKRNILEYLTEEKFYPLSTSDEALKSPYEQHPVTICGQTIIFTNGELAAALLSLPEKKRAISSVKSISPDAKPLYAPTWTGITTAATFMCIS
jgi:hypothetical protein